LHLSDEEVQSPDQCAFRLRRLQEDAERYFGKPACLSLVYVFRFRSVEAWQLGFKIESFEEGMAEFRNRYS
jgi:hypothetical protein